MGITTQALLGSLIRRYRREAELTQEALAERAGLSVRVIRRIENGSPHRPRQDTVRQLLKALAVPEDEQPAFWAAAGQAWFTATQRASELTSPDRSATALMDQQLPTGGFAGSLPVGPMVGRETELACVLDAVDAVVQGEGRLVLLTGEPGVGKTRLVQEVTVAVREREFVVAAGRCYEPEQTVPYYPFLDVVTALWALASVEVRAEAARRWPHLGMLLPDELPVPQTSASPGQDQQRVFRAVTGFVEAMAQIAPIALVLDDLHWADSASIDLLLHLARHTRGASLLVLGTYRDVEVDAQHPLWGALRDLTREQLVERIALRWLPDGGTAALIRERLGEVEQQEEFARLVHRYTDGNPFFVTQVLQALTENGTLSRQEERWAWPALGEITLPETVRAVIGQRIARLSDTAQTILREASILGQTFDFDDLQRMSSRAEEEVDAGLQAASALGMLQPGSQDRYRFDHALTQQTLSDALSPPMRRRLHRTAGEALECLPEQQRQQRVAEIAWHFLEGRDSERALRYALLAGEQAQRIFAQSEAERQYRTALHLARDRGDQIRERLALQKLGVVLRTVGRYDEALQVLEDAARAYAGSGDLEAEAVVVSQIGFLHTDRGTADEGVPLLEPVLERLEGRVSSSGLAALYLPMVWLYEQQGRFRDRLAAAERAVELAEASQNQALMATAQMLLGHALCSVSAKAARQALETAVCLAEDVGDLDTLFWALHALVVAHGELGEPDTEQGYAARALEIAERVDDPHLIAAAEQDLADAYFTLGEWPQVRVHATRCAKILRSLSSSFLLSGPEVHLAQLGVAEGDWELAATYMEEVISAERIRHPIILWEALRIRAELDLLQGQAADALAHLQPLLTDAHVAEAQWTRHLAPLAETYLELGDSERARAVLDEGLALARAMQNRRDLLAMQRVEGMLLAREGRWEEATEAFRDAVSLARRSSSPYAEARVLYAWGQMHRMNGASQQAQDDWLEALAIFRRLGARPYIERTEAVLAELARHDSTHRTR